MPQLCVLCAIFSAYSAVKTARALNALQHLSWEFGVESWEWINRFDSPESEVWSPKSINRFRQLTD
jgi:hypothetical protein